MQVRDDNNYCTATSSEFSIIIVINNFVIINLMIPR